MTNNDKLRCGSSEFSVRAATTARSQDIPLEMNVFAPLITYSSPSRFAVVAMPAKSDPVPGSVIASAVIVSPLAQPGSHLAFCSGLPNEWM